MMNTPKPEWLKKRIFDSPKKESVLALLGERKLNTVCQSARCPNLCECFDRGTATFMILGDTCTRSCRFCAVNKGPVSPLDDSEPLRVAETVRDLALKHAVITSVTRDDLDDGGADQFIETISHLRLLCPQIVIEILTPDFKGDLGIIRKFNECVPDIFNHNLETVPRLYSTIRPEASYDRSLSVLKAIHDHLPDVLVKSGIMVGLGETEDEVIAVLNDLKANFCDIVSIGQYLAPTKDHAPVLEYVTPDKFKTYENAARALGFKQVFSGPFVRSSYLADSISALGHSHS